MLLGQAEHPRRISHFHALSSLPRPLSSVGSGRFYDFLTLFAAIPPVFSCHPACFGYNLSPSTWLSCARRPLCRNQEGRGRRLASHSQIRGQHDRFDHCTRSSNNLESDSTKRLVDDVLDSFLSLTSASPRRARRKSQRSALRNLSAPYPFIHSGRRSRACRKSWHVALRSPYAVPQRQSLWGGDGGRGMDVDVDC